MSQRKALLVLLLAVGLVFGVTRLQDQRKPETEPPPPPPPVEEKVEPEPEPGRGQRSPDRRADEDRTHRRGSHPGAERSGRAQDRLLRLRQVGPVGDEPRDAAAERRLAARQPGLQGRDRGPLRRARHDRVQPRARRTPRARDERRSWLELGVDGSNLRLVSYGEERPAVEGSSESAWSKNRRAEFWIESKGQQGDDEIPPGHRHDRHPRARGVSPAASCPTR